MRCEIEASIVIIHTPRQLISTHVENIIADEQFVLLIFDRCVALSLSKEMELLSANRVVA